jgi:hypothetical protein
MFKIEDETRAIEALLKGCGKNLHADLLIPAGIHRKTWQRWKDGDLPTMSKWQEVERVLTKLKRAA